MKKVIVLLTAIMMIMSFSVWAEETIAPVKNEAVAPPNRGVADLLKEASKEVAAAENLYAESKGSSNSDIAYKHLQKSQELLALADAKVTEKGAKMRGSPACHTVITFVCRWDDGAQYCHKASQWICG